MIGCAGRERKQEGGMGSSRSFKGGGAVFTIVFAESGVSCCVYIHKRQKNNKPCESENT